MKYCQRNWIHPSPCVEGEKERVVERAGDVYLMGGGQEKSAWVVILDAFYSWGFSSRELLQMFVPQFMDGQRFV